MWSKVQRALRSTKRNRIIVKVEAYGNAEFRYKFIQFKWLKQYWYLSSNIFLDAGKTVQLLPLENKVLKITKEKLLTDYNL